MYSVYKFSTKKYFTFQFSKKKIFEVWTEMRLLNEHDSYMIPNLDIRWDKFLKGRYGHYT